MPGLHTLSLGRHRAESGTAVTLQGTFSETDYPAAPQWRILPFIALNSLAGLWPHVPHLLPVPEFSLLYNGHLGIRSCLFLEWTQQVSSCCKQPAASMSQLCCMQMAVLSKCTCFKWSLQSQHCILEQERAQRQLRPFARMQQETAETSLGNIALKMFAEPCYISNSESSGNLTHKMGRTKLEGKKQVAGKLEINL